MLQLQQRFVSHEYTTPNHDEVPWVTLVLPARPSPAREGLETYMQFSCTSSGICIEPMKHTLYLFCAFHPRDLGAHVDWTALMAAASQEVGLSQAISEAAKGLGYELRENQSGT